MSKINCKNCKWFIIWDWKTQCARYGHLKVINPEKDAYPCNYFTPKCDSKDAFRSAIDEKTKAALEKVVKTILKGENQAVKADSGKPKLSLVPRQILFDIAKIREFGTKKYGDPDNWKKVDIQRYRDAAFRHFMAYLDDPQGLDEESGLSHLAHLACNIAFLCELEAKERKSDAGNQAENN